ncbi:MAG: Bug family tripartite tricarboxylate transporter substrate binding protein [Burkholderiales bacterium]
MAHSLRTSGYWKFLLGIGLASVAAGGLAQQPYPNHPIRLIVPLAPGGPSTILAHTMAKELTVGLGQTVFVDNRSGAGGTVGSDIAAKSPGDGYTMMLISASTYTINASLFAKLPFDARKDLTPVTILAAGASLVTVHPSLPVKTLKELVALDKARPGELNYGAGGTTGQLHMEMLKLRTGMGITNIPYKGAGPALIDQLAGHVQVSFLNMIATTPLVRSGKLRALAVNGSRRSSVHPTVPTLMESGVSGFEEISGHMIVVPSATPRDIIARLNREMVKALNTSDVKSRLAAEGAEVVGNSPEEAAAVVRREFDRWAEVIRLAKIPLQ